MNRICIIGGSGTGKTTLANNLGEQLKIPVCHIDGTYHSTLKQRLDKSDYVIYLDYSTVAQIKGKELLKLYKKLIAVKYIFLNEDKNLINGIKNSLIKKWNIKIKKE